MTNLPLISVIIPVYNVESYLEKCLDSIINQTYKNLQIILIDDGSTDNCKAICGKYQKLDRRIIVIHQENQGLSNARNKGLDIAKGSLIAFVDSDDFLEPTMYEELYNNMRENDSDIAICNFYRIDKHGAKTTLHFRETEFVSTNKTKFSNIQNEYGSLTVYAWNKLYKRKIFDNIRYPDGKVYEDSFILCDILAKATKVSYLLKPLYNYVYRPDSITNNFSLAHFDKIGSFNRKIDFFHKQKYFDLERKEKHRKLKFLIRTLLKTPLLLTTPFKPLP